MTPNSGLGKANRQKISGEPKNADVEDGKEIVGPGQYYRVCHGNAKHCGETSGLSRPQSRSQSPFRLQWPAGCPSTMVPTPRPQHTEPAETCLFRPRLSRLRAIIVVRDRLGLDPDPGCELAGMCLLNRSRLG